MQNHNSDIILIQDLLNGVPGALNRIIDEYKLALLNFAFKHAQTREEAEEIAADVFILLYEKPIVLHTCRSLKSYLFRITQNKCYDGIKKTHPAASKQMQPVLSESEEQCIEELIIQKEQSQMVKGAIEILPKQQREIFLLLFQEGLTINEIAMKLNIQPHTVRVQKHRAIKTIREKVREMKIY
jgi:RNA polymerase sigma factor (sigma-70 family)